MTLCAVFAACTPEEKAPLVIKDSDTCIVIAAADEQMSITGDTVLLSYMLSLKKNKKLEFEIKDGMVTSINGKANAADYSSCWMLYTSDAENANSAWGTVEYNGKIYGSAVFGADKLVIKNGELYIWVYQTF